MKISTSHVHKQIIVSECTISCTMNFILDNLGNTCYLNTALQCLFRSNSLLHEICVCNSNNIGILLFKKLIENLKNESNVTAKQSLKNVITYMNHKITIMELIGNKKGVKVH